MLDLRNTELQRDRNRSSINSLIAINTCSAHVRRLQCSLNELPQFLLARLWPAKGLKQLLELNHPTSGELEGLLRRENGLHELIIIWRGDVIHAEVGARDEPDQRRSKAVRCGQKTNQGYDQVNVKETHICWHFWTSGLSRWFLTEWAIAGREELVPAGDRYWAVSMMISYRMKGLKTELTVHRQKSCRYGVPKKQRRSTTVEAKTWSKSLPSFLAMLRSHLTSSP